MEEAPLNWVVAWRAEAQPVIDHFRLRRVNGAAFELYASPCETTHLVISGMGKLRSAAATGWLGATIPERCRGGGWINFGTAGSRRDELGSVFLATAIRDLGSSSSFYPVPTWPRKLDLARKEVTTVEAPTSEYPEENLVEMEAAGFYAAALAFASVERCQVLKVVSDNQEHGIDQLDPAQGRQLCEMGFAECLVWLAGFREAIADSPERDEWLGLLQKWREETTLTRTLEVQLGRLLEEGLTLGVDGHALLPSAFGGGSSKAETKKSLESLRQQIDSARLVGNS